jgi:flavin-dependent dehydrogenase
MFDVVVVGARVAGASTALLLARHELRVLLVDRARFPSDTVSTHQVQVPGGAKLRRWGLLERITAAGTPPARRARFDSDGVVLSGRFPAVDGVNAVYSPRRVVLDALLVDAAREAGVEVRERFVVDGLLTEGGAVVGIEGHGTDRVRVQERAPLVVGADGKHSMVAAGVAAPAYHDSPPTSVASYTYWSGVALDGGELYGRSGERRMIGAWPTNNGLVMTYVAAPISELAAIRSDPLGHLLGALDLCGDLGERIRAGAREHRLVVTPDLPARVRRPHGPGWALVGDAGLVMDPATGMGIADAFRDAELLADAASRGLDAGGSLPDALAGYHAARDRAALPMYRFTADLARLAPQQPQQRLLLQAVAGDTARTEQFLGVLTGVVDVDEYFAPRNLLRILGVRGMLRAARLQRRRAA